MFKGILLVVYVLSVFFVSSMAHAAAQGQPMYKGHNGYDGDLKTILKDHHEKVKTKWKVDSDTRNERVKKNIVSRDAKRREARLKEKRDRAHGSSGLW